MLMHKWKTNRIYAGSADKTVKFWDLETFELIGSAGPEVCSNWSVTKAFCIACDLNAGKLWKMLPFLFPQVPYILIIFSNNGMMLKNQAMFHNHICVIYVFLSRWLVCILWYLTPMDGHCWRVYKNIWRWVFKLYYDG